MTSYNRRLPAPHLLFLIPFALSACSSPSGSSMDSESHFLQSCQSDADCGSAYQCLCSLCTIACDSDDVCVDESAPATCVDPASSLFSDYCGTALDIPQVGVCFVGCQVNGDCSSLGPGYDCQGSTCTYAFNSNVFNVPDTGSADMFGDLGVDLSMDSTDAAVSDSADDALSDTADTSAQDVSSVELTLEALDLDTEGGFTGLGGTDYHLSDGSLTVFDPFAGEETECSAPLLESQLERLSGLAEVVNWAALEPTYVHPENPDCCCDQIASTFTVQVTIDGAPVSKATAWCSATRSDLPQPVLELLGALDEIGSQVWLTCGPGSFTDLELDLDTSGGLGGLGHSDFHLAAGELAAFNPHADPTDCAARITPSQRDLLLNAAQQVDWNGLDASYVDPLNPLCCCDQIVSEFSIALATADGGSVEASTEWCDESRMPAELEAFLMVLTTVGNQVQAYCEPLPEDCAQAAENDTFISVEELEERLEAMGAGTFWVEGLISADEAFCNESCYCHVNVGLQSETTFYGLDFLTDDKIPGCASEACSLFGYCDTPHPGEWARVKIGGPLGDTTLMNLLTECPIESTPRSDPLFFWQAPGGEAGTGPAVAVTDGEIRIWFSTDEGLPGDDEEPDAVLTTTTHATNELFERFSQVDTGALPHALVEPEADCYPAITVELCSTCEPTSLSYRRVEQLTPEMEEVLQWFDAVLGAIPEEVISPREWCEL